MNGNLRKDQNFVKFGSQIEMDSCFGPQFSSTYELRSVVEHLGGANSGHFITMRRHNWGANLDTNLISKSHVEEKHTKAYLELIQSDLRSESQVKTGTWVLANDAEIRFISLKQVLQSNAYMLFYSLRP